MEGEEGAEIEISQLTYKNAREVVDECFSSESGCFLFLQSEFNVGSNRFYNEARA